MPAKWGEKLIKQLGRQYETLLRPDRLLVAAVDADSAQCLQLREAFIKGRIVGAYAQNILLHTD